MFYPSDKQAEVQAKRAAGKLGGKRSGVSRRSKQLPDSKNEAQLKASCEADIEAALEADLKRKGKERNRNRKEKLVKVADASATNDTDWIKELQNNPAYAGLDVERELGKMQVWCATNNKLSTRRRFINWLNRAERPIAINGTPVANGTPARQTSAWSLKQSLEAVKTQIERLRSNPDNSEPKDPSTPWDRQLTETARRQHKELKQREQELTHELSMLGATTGTPRLKL